MPRELYSLLQAVVMLVAVALICYYNFMAVRLHVCSQQEVGSMGAVEQGGFGWSRCTETFALAGGRGSLPPCGVVSALSCFRASIDACAQPLMDRVSPPPAPSVALPPLLRQLRVGGRLERRAVHVRRADVLALQQARG